MARKVLIVYKYVPRYRQEFFSRLRRRLAPGIDLKVSAGRPWGAQASKGDEALDPWYDRHVNIVVPLPGAELIWQRHVLAHAKEADAVIVEQANSLLVNQVLMARARPTAYWGHGYNHQVATRNRLSESLKALQVRLPSWWFGYTDATRKYLIDNGVPSDRITVVQNAVDTDALRALAGTSAAEDLKPKALYLGSLYREKQLDYLVQVGQRLAERINGFALHVAGDGPLRTEMEAWSGQFSWLHYHGRVDSPEEKVNLARNAAFLLNPGLIGLAVVEAFALGLPIVTKGGSNHSPEFGYLVDGTNALILDASANPNEMAERCVAELRDPDRINKLRLGARRSGEHITLDAMVEKFATGVEEWIASLD